MKGEGRNGKGTLYEALIFALGDYADMANPELFLASNRTSDPNAANPSEMDLRGLRLVIVSESGRDRALDEARLKRLVGGDPIKGRGLFQNQRVGFPPSHLALFVTNHLPKASGDKAVWARLHVVPFDVVIPEAEQDRHLGEKLELEADAILSWAIAGYADYVKRGEHLEEPAAVRVATQEYRADSDEAGSSMTTTGC